MPELNRSNDNTNLGPGQLGINQGDFREQQEVLADSVLMLGGRGEVNSGDVVSKALNAPFILYVNPYIGSDNFVFGSYSTEDDDREEELRRIELQRLECGYTEAAPFLTINRAIIEAGLITNKDYWSNVDQDDQRVCIVLAPGVYDVDCRPGDTVANTPEFVQATHGDGNIAFLRRFNPRANQPDAPPVGGGIILPRGCSMVSMDLRKTIIRPVAAAVPAVADEQAIDNNGHYPNRAAIFRMTGEGFYYGFTFMDFDGANRSHHLMSCFEFATTNQVSEFYDKLNAAFSNVANWNDTGEWDTEDQIVGPQPALANLTEATDTTDSASPYIFNCSIRSEWGLCGVLANGQDVRGFRSCVIAQFTGVSLQRDLSCWQVWDNTDFDQNPADFNALRADSPNDVRMDPDRRSFHIRAVNNAVIQEVSVFAIGQGVHHHVDRGGEITITNSNSNFGGCAAIAEGFKDFTFPQDQDYEVLRVRRPTDLSEKRNNIRKIVIGETANTQTTALTRINLTANLTGDTDNEPDVLGDYTLQPGTRIWVESDNGNDFTAVLSATAWDASTNQDRIETEAALARGNDADGTADGTAIANADLQGRNVYIRRLIDTRTPEERTYSFICQRDAANRVPVRDYVIQEDGNEATGVNLTCVQDPKTGTLGATNIVEFKARQLNPRQDANLGASTNDVEVQGWRTYYRAGDPVRNGVNGKHFICVQDHYDVNRTPDFTAASGLFVENNIHTETGTNANHNPEDFFKNTSPIILFDYDLSDRDDQADLITAREPLGIELDSTDANSVWRNEGSPANTVANAIERMRWQVQAQYTTATDYRGCFTTCRQRLNGAGNGFDSDANAFASLLPVQSANVLLDVSGQSEVFDFRRPSSLRLFGHAYEYAGYLNYTKALPRYQQELSKPNRFTYYGTSKDGGRVYFTGFNEEGFAVSNRGIEDITTGEIETPENPDAEGPNCAFFNCLRVGTGDAPALSVAGTTTLSQDVTISQGLTVAGNATFNGNVDASDEELDFENTDVNLDSSEISLDGATVDLDDTDVENYGMLTNHIGVGDLATIADLEDRTVPANNGDIETATDTHGNGTDLVNVAGLNYVLFDRNVVTANENVTEIFVSNDTAGVGDTINVNGTDIVLAFDPDRAIADVRDNPPTTDVNACTFRRASQWANEILSERETARYRLADGRYFNAVPSFNHIAQVEGAVAEFPNGNVVANYDNANTSPTTDVDNLLDTLAIPVFATGMQLRNTSGSSNRFNAIGRPVQLIFNQGGWINGCGWLGAQDTYTDTQFPNNLFPGMTEVRAANSDIIADLDQSMANFGNAGNMRFDRFYGRTTIFASGGERMRIRNCVFGAKGVNIGNVGYGERGPIVRLGRETQVEFSGIYLLGNLIAQNADWQDADDAGVNVRYANVTGRGNCGSLTDGRTSVTRAANASVTFPAVARHNLSNNNRNGDRNLDVNCIHILDNNGNYGLQANDNATNGTAGAAMYAIIGDMPPGSILFTGGYNSWRRGFLTNGNTGHHGFAGRFGERDFAGTKTQGMSRTASPQNRQRFNAYSDSVWQMARDGQSITEAAGDANPGPGLTAEAYSTNPNANPLNIRSRIWGRGIDTATANQNGREFYA